MRARIAVALVVAGAICGAGNTPIVPIVPPADPPARASVVRVEHRYRVYGRIRLALFWTRGSVVGTARMSSHVLGDHSELTFLLGSDPDWAPGGMNQWSYVREETRGSRAASFGLRTLSANDLVDRSEPALPDNTIFGASCGFVNEDGIGSVLTRVKATGVTYRMFDRILEAIDRAPEWRPQHLPPSAGVSVGLLSAMAAQIRRVGQDPALLKALPPVTYLFDDTLYDLSVRDTRTTGPVEIGSTRFERLTRIDFVIVNQRTRVATRFLATFTTGPDASLPVQVVFQPNFWVRVELRLDEGADAPADPATDPVTVERIRAMCARASAQDAHPASAVAASPPRNWRR